MAADDDNGDGTNLFDVFSASPLKSNDEGSLDIYAGLDNVVSDSASKSCVPFRNCLDLYEEILTEEGTAKEATYNDLQVEYGKCQLQMKELMKKFKEIQTQNFSLKNENQSLKKNISALIKTARVEINRKDEEINNLHQRLSEFPHFRNNHKIARTSDIVKTKDFKSRSSPHLDDCSKTDHRVKSDVSKDVHHSTSPPKLEKEGKSHSEKKSTSHLPTSSEKHCANGIWSRSHYQIGEGSSNEDNRRGRIDIRHSQCSRGTDRLRKEFNTACDGEPRNTEASQRLQGRPEKYGKGEPKTEKNSKFKSNSDLDYKNEHMNTSWEKEASRERSYARVDSQNDKKLERQSERSQSTNRKELKSQDREERKADQKPKSVVKDQDHWRRSERALFPHSKNEIKSQNSNKYHLEERRGREDCKRDRGVSSHSFSEGRYPSCLSTSRTHKHIDSKEIEGKRENVTLKAERHRTEDKRKRERESKEENRHMRYEKKTPAEHLQKTNKEVKKTTTDLKRQNGPKDDKSEISNNIASEGTANKELANKGESGPNETKNKDLKLSFMEKLNLTLSPAKKQPVSQDNQHKVTNTPKSNDICDLDSVQTKTVTCVPSVNEHITEETKPKLLEPEALAAISEPRTCIPERKTEEHGLIIKSADNAINCDMPICGTETSFSAPVEVEQNKSLFPSIEMEQTINGASTTIPMVMDILQTNLSQNFGLELDTKRTDGLNSCSISEDIEMKETLSTEVAKSNESILQPSIEEAGILPVVPSEDGNPKFEPALVDTQLVESKSCHLEPCLPKETLESIQQTVLMDHRMEIGETNSVYHDDENSVLSIDFNHLRPIPEAISPLNSPVRPAAKLPRLESPSRVPLFNSHKDVFPQNSTQSTSKSQSDLNKENQKPTQKPDKCIEADSCKNPSLDELEEGEILSDSENSKPQKHFGKSAKPRVSTKIQSTKTSPGSRKSTVYLEKDNRKTSTKIHQTKSKWNKRRSGSSRSSNTEKKEKIMSTSSLEKIVPIIAVPASVPEVLHMLRVIRKHVRKNYMKFKVKFSLIQFHRIIESAILNFTSLIKHLDLSKISKSAAALQKNLCDVIESKLKQVKKNGIVDRLFEQQLPDMKKKLWKFVDEQLDYLFAKLKKILLKFCESVNFVSDSDEGKVEKINKEKAPHSKYQKGNVNNSKKEMLKEKSPKLEDSAYSKSLLGSKKSEEKHQDQSNSGIHTIKHDTKKNFNTCFDNIKNSHSNGHSLELNCSSMPKPEKNEGNTIEDAQTSQHVALKPERSFEILTEQQASSLTFNLVSDAQMGEIFKSLLQGSDLLDNSVNCNEKNEWELKTPEKQLLETLKCESLPTCTTEELVSGVVSPCPKMISDDNWSLLSSEKGPSLSSGLSLPVHPDVLDESCMFEVASNIALSKDNVCSSEKSKPCISSILLEDLAVSLTVPSPLKSDGHLSFLKPEVLSSSTPEEVISAHFSEDALLEEEDASEQDIHLALESDNSSSKSSCSSSWTSRSVITPGFQYHPNLPMHAVIMEKSNDHFIVKIRRAPPSTSPTLKQNMVTDESLASLPGVGKEADEAAEKEYISCQTRVCKSMEELKNSNNNVDSKSAHGEQDCMISTQVPDIYEFLKDASGKADHSNEVTDECFKLHQVWETKVPGNIEEVPSVEEIPNSVEDHLPNTYIDLTKDTVTETKNIGDFIEVTVLSIDQLGCSGDNLNQNAQILDSMQSDAVDAFIDLTQDVSSESKNEGNCPLAIEGLGCQVICVDEDNCKEEKMKVTNKTLECIVRESYIDLTSESPSSCEIKKSDLKSEPASHSDSTELPGVLDNPHKKRKNLSDINHSQKKQRKETNLTTKEKTKKITHVSGENGEVHRRKTSKKKAYTVTKDPSSSKASSVAKDPSATPATSTSLSAKNVVKKKGEIVVSWTRNDDREILLECQKRAPSSKTFSYLAAKLNKKPYQVSERFQQLKELFEKSKCR